MKLYKPLEIFSKDQVCFHFVFNKMTYMNGPTFICPHASPSRADFVSVMDELEHDLPGYRFCCDPSREGGMRLLHYPGYRPSMKDMTWLLCVLRRAVSSIPGILSNICKSIGSMCFGDFGVGHNSPYKVIRMHGLNWPHVSGVKEFERLKWRNDHTPIMRGTISTCLKAFSNAPRWTAHELETICKVLYRRLGVRPKGWSSCRANYVTKNMQKRLREF